MDNKTLAEIILKKIREVEAITENFTRPEPIYQIDIDLALSKVRSLYNELLMLGKLSVETYRIPSGEPVEREIIETAGPPAGKQEDEMPVENSQVVETGSTAGTAVVEIPEEEPEEPEKNIPESVAMDSFELVEEPEEKAAVDMESEIPVASEPEVITTPEPAEEPEPEPVSVPLEKSGGTEIKETKGGKKKQPTLFDGTASGETPKGNRATVADQFKDTRKESVNDLISKFKKETDLATQLKYKPIKDIKSAISLNDKIMFIKELFNDNANACNEALDTLNKMKDLDEAMAYINENYDWSNEKEGFSKFIELVYRRFI